MPAGIMYIYVCVCVRAHACTHLVWSSMYMYIYIANSYLYEITEIKDKITLASLPKHKAQQFQSMHFISCSNRLSAIEMSRRIVDDLLALEKGVRMFDDLTNSEVLVIAPVIRALCDNVRASEIVNHLGSKVKRLCRICMV